MFWFTGTYMKFPDLRVFAMLNTHVNGRVQALWGKIRTSKDELAKT